MPEEICKSNKLPEPRVPYTTGFGPHEDEIIFKTMGRKPESRSGVALKQLFLHQCKHCMRIRAEFPEGL